MKTDATIAVSIPSRAEARGPQTPGHRWLADLERAWLEVQTALPERLHQGANASPSAQSGASGANTPCAVPASFANGVLSRNHAAESSPASRHEASVDLATAPGRAQRVGTTASSGVAIEWTGAFEEGCFRTDQAAPPENAALLLVRAPLNSAVTIGMSTTPMEAPIVATNTPLLSEKSSAGLREVQITEEPATEAALKQQPEAPAYARRLLQVSGGGELQINIRDAALSASQREAVAQASAVRADGFYGCRAAALVRQRTSI